MGKCKFLKQNLEFFGMIFSTEGVGPDPKKISAFVNTATPSTVSEVRSLIGMANYSSQFIPNFATITEPLRRLTHKGVKFVWQPEHEEAYHKLKTAMINSPVMNYFDISKKTHVCRCQPCWVICHFGSNTPGQGYTSKYYCLCQPCFNAH